MISAAQLRAARALLGIDQRKLAELSALSLPTIQRMEASDGVIRGNVDLPAAPAGVPNRGRGGPRGGPPLPPGPAPPPRHLPPPSICKQNH